jgi:hypothetical protein
MTFGGWSGLSSDADAMAWKKRDACMRRSLSSTQHKANKPKMPGRNKDPKFMHRRQRL